MAAFLLWLPGAILITIQLLTQLCQLLCQNIRTSMPWIKKTRLPVQYGVRAGNLGQTQES
jgi:hypothetical protein